MKKSPLGDYAYLAHMRDAIKTIKSYTRQGEGAFFKSQLLQDGVCRQLGIMGEAANKISAITRKKLDGMPWNEVDRKSKLPCTRLFRRIPADGLEERYSAYFQSRNRAR